MKKIELKANLRKEVGKKATKALRVADIVPCVVYGGENVIHFQVEEKSFKNLVYTPHVFLVKIDIDGKSINAVIKDIQFHPVTDKINHVDFMEVLDNKPISVKMPVELTGTSVGIKEGGKLRFRRRWVLVKALAKDIPEVLKIDISSLEIGDAIHIHEVEIPNVELIGPNKAMIVGIVSSRIAKGMEEGVVEVAETEDIDQVEEVAEDSEATDTETKQEDTPPAEK